MHALLGQSFHNKQAELAQLYALAREFRMAGNDSQHVPRSRIRVHPQKEVRSRKIEEAQSVRLHDLREVHKFTQFSGDWRNAHCHDRITGLRRSQQVADGADSTNPRRDSRHFIKRVALGEFLKAAHLSDAEFSVGDVAQIIEMNRDLGVTLDAAYGLDGDALHQKLLIRISPSDCRWVSYRPADH